VLPSVINVAGGWNAPHINTKHSAEAWWETWKKWNAESGLHFDGIVAFFFLFFPLFFPSLFAILVLCDGMFYLPGKCHSVSHLQVLIGIWKAMTTTTTNSTNSQSSSCTSWARYRPWPSEMGVHTYFFIILYCVAFYLFEILSFMLWSQFLDSSFLWLHRRATATLLIITSTEA
jgi:hypothetical protein